jgi:hypothetical protein
MTRRARVPWESLFEEDATGTMKAGRERHDHLDADFPKLTLLSLLNEDDAAIREMRLFNMLR